MRSRIIVAVAVAVALVVMSGCGSRVKDQTAADPTGFGAGQAPGGPTGNVGPATTAAMFGTLASPCGPNTSGQANKASDKGVTAGEINIATIADPGGIRPGLNQGVFDSMESFTAWCNDQGGINGRKLVLHLRDAALVKYKEMVLDACDEDFALVGGIGAFDSLGAQDALDCGLVNVPAAAVSPEQTTAKNTVQPLPNPPDKYSIGPAQWVKRTFPDAPSRAAELFSKVSITEFQSEKLIEAYTTVGFTFIMKQSANISETNWGPIVVEMKNKDVRYASLTSSFEEVVPLQKEMARQNYKPQVMELESNFYNQKYPEQAGSVADGTFVRLTSWPFEEADANPAMRSYLDALKKTTPDAVPESLGVASFSAGLLWATAVKQLGPDVTRKGVLDALHGVHNWDGGGLQGVSDPGGNEPSSCYIIMKVANNGFVREYPLKGRDAAAYEKGKGFDCPTDGIVTLSGPYIPDFARRSR